jgi:hypothetical protein
MTITFVEFLDMVDQTFHKHHELRYGQTIMNILYELWPSKHSELVSNHVDCFYDDDNIEYVLSHLKKEWKTNE